MIKLSKRDINLEQKAKRDVKKILAKLKVESIVIEMFEEAGRDINEVDDVSIKFVKNLDVSAKTVNGRIYLNAKMLEEPWEDYFNYAVHEITHFLSHTSGDCAGHQDQDVSYLDNPDEIKAFKNQLEYKEKTEPKNEVDQYLDKLFDKHDLEGKERKDKKKELLGKK